jgi:hypothetical protein
MGNWNDTQIPNTYSHYGDRLWKLCFKVSKKKWKKKQGINFKKLILMHEFIKQGDVLHRHKDRYSCEVSTTLNLGGDPWPIYLEPSGKTGMAGIKVDLKQGDMLDYIQVVILNTGVMPFQVRIVVKSFFIIMIEPRKQLKKTFMISALFRTSSMV